MIKLGQRLSDERRSRGLSISEVSSSTKIKEEFLNAIEKGEYHRLPSTSYAQGFVRSYIRFLELPERDTFALFRREFAGEKEFKVLPEGFTQRKGIPIRKFKIKQIFVIGILVFLLLIGYIVFQYRYVLIDPPLNIKSPDEMETISSSTFSVEGHTDSQVTVFIGDESVLVDQDGNFKKEIVSFSGENIIDVKAVNRFGRETTVTRRVVVK